MEYNFREIEKKWQQRWKDTNAYKVENNSPKPKYYVLDMFPYPSGAGLHVGHPLGYIASDIFARFKRLKGFNVLHPMGYDAFGLPAEQYAIEKGVHPAVSTEQNIQNFRKQLDNIGFCYDWDREVRTSDPSYYKWTQWIFLQLFKSFYNKVINRADSIEVLVASFEKEGNAVHPFPASANYQPSSFTAGDWNSFAEAQQQEILMQYRLAYCGIGEVNWCEALGTVLANDEVVNGVSERGGYPVVKKKLRQWYLRITEYADRLLEGLESIAFSDAMKEMQSNWIGKSSGAEIVFPLSISPRRGEEMEERMEKIDEEGGIMGDAGTKRMPGFGYPQYKVDNPMSFENAKKMRDNPTEAESVLWSALKSKGIGYKFRRQHPVGNYIADFICLDVWLIIEIDGGYHSNEVQKKSDAERDAALKDIGFTILRFSNEEVLFNLDGILLTIKQHCDDIKKVSAQKISLQTSDSVFAGSSPLQGEAGVRVYTTRPDTIFGVDFMVIAPEHELVDQITTEDQKASVDDYITYVKSRSERERMAEKKITGCFTGAYAVNPFNGQQIPIWISEYVLAGYGTGAIMAVPCGDERDFKFAQHFNIPITNIIGKHFNGEDANPTKDALLENSGFLNGMVMRQAIDVVCTKIEEMGIGKRKVNFRMRDAAFSRQRYWGEPFPIKWVDGIAYPLDESELPLELPHVEKYGPGPEGEGPLANIPGWALIPNPSPQVEKGAAKSMETVDAKGAANVPKYKVLTPMQYELAKNMRKGHTDAEKMLWEQLRDSKLGVKFRRQHPVDAYIVDFIALQEKLVVEVDGGYHEDKEQKEYDDNRTKILNGIGFTVIRFSNEEVLANVYSVRDAIKKIIAKSKIGDDTLKEGAAFAAPLSTSGEGLGVRETNTMPGYAGSSWYFLRYMDPHNNTEFCNRAVSDYWGQVDLYIGGTEHAVGHLLYSRMWTKVLYDLGHIGHDEPYKKLVNQGMIQGSSRFVYRIHGTNTFVSSNLINEIVYTNPKDYVLPYNLSELDKLHVDVNLVDGYELDVEAFKQWKPDYANAEFIYEDGSTAPLSTRGEGSGVRYICGSEVEKMSKSKYNTVNPDDLVVKFGADTFRMYEMFLGPVEQSKPWDTKGIEGVHRFLRKLWRMFYDDAKGKVWTDTKATDAELKILHKAIKKIEDDTERFSFNTAVSAFMVCVNELTDVKCNKKEVLEPLVIMLTPYAPHIAEELYQALNGATVSVLDAAFPIFEAKYLVESSKEYPISINGKLRTTITMPLGISKDEVQETVLANEVVAKWLEGKPPKNLIYVPNKMVNVVI